MFMNHAKAQWVLVVRLERAGAPGFTGLFRLVRMRLGDRETRRHFPRIVIPTEVEGSLLHNAYQHVCGDREMTSC